MLRVPDDLSYNVFRARTEDIIGIILENLLLADATKTSHRVIYISLTHYRDIPHLNFYIIEAWMLQRI